MEEPRQHQPPPPQQQQQQAEATAEHDRGNTTALPPIEKAKSPASDEPEGPADPDAVELNRVLHSEIGVTALLTRLKQSIASTRDFATFLRKRGVLEEEHAQGLKKLARTVHDAATRSDNKQGSFGTAYDEMNKIQERTSDHGLQFAASLHQMSDDLNELITNMERGRKHWKQNGLAAEKRVVDSESAAEKAKSKYDSLAEQYDRARTGDRAPGKFGIKVPKSAAQQEEDLLRKVQQADSDYANKVQSAQAQRQELTTALRPQAVQAMRELIEECDAALALQMQKLATFSEKLLLGSGLSVSPMKTGKGQSENGQLYRSLRYAAQQVDNEKDFKLFVLSYSSKVGAEATPIKYERHPTLAVTQQTGHPKRHSLSVNNQPPAPQSAAQTLSQPTPSAAATHPPPAMQRAGQGAHGSPANAEPTSYQQFSARRPHSREKLPPTPTTAPPAQSQPQAQHPDLPPLNPVFGVSLDNLFQRDGTAIPMVVYQCIQAVELFGLDVEGIYRLSGHATHIAHMKALFDNDSSQVDFTNPENFYHDVNSVAGLLKQFFRDLPDPLFTEERYNDFIAAARKDDDIQRRDTLHALINSLPDANYATLRALVLHLNHIQERSSENRMNAGNIAICFGLTLLGSSAGRSISDSGWHARIIETILQNTFQIFDDDD